MRPTLRAIGTATLLVLASAPRPALADDAAARTHFQAGVKRYDAKPPDYEGALAEFRAAYAEKASPSIHRNIALCLRALGRYLEAIDALEGMLREGAGRLSPKVEAAAKKAIDEMSAEIATLSVHVVPKDAGVWIDGEQVPPERLASPLRVAAGSHAVVARATGFADAERRITVAAGDRDVDVTLEMKPGSSSVARGRLRLHASVKGASISVDGVPIATGEWEGELTAGEHHVEARAPGMTPWGDEVEVVAGVRSVVEIPLGGTDAARRPPPVGDRSSAQAPPASPEPNRRVYLVLGFDAQTGVRTLSPIVFEEALPTVRGFSGAALMAKLGLRVSQVVSVELFGDAGVLASKTYDSPHLATKSTHVDIAHVDIGPEVRLRTRGTGVRATAATGLLLHAEWANATLGEPTSVTVPAGTTPSFGLVSGSGASAGWIGELGLEISVSRRVSFDVSGFFTVHGIAGIKDDAGQRLFLDSPAARGGLRLGVDYSL